MANREFTVAGSYSYNRSSAGRWLLSHVLRYKGFVALFVGGSLAYSILNALVPRISGFAFNAVLAGNAPREQLVGYALTLLALMIVKGVLDPAAIFGSEFLAQRLERDARDELYLSLLGKSQTFHNQQQVGDIMARANNDVRQLNAMMNPGIYLILDSGLALLVPLIVIATINVQLLLVPLLFTVGLGVTLRDYVRRLNPVAGALRARFGAMNAGLAETITGIEVVKSSAQEEQEKRKFARNAGSYREYFIRNGQIQARYLPLLVFVVALALAFVHGLLLAASGQISTGDLVAFLALVAFLRYPTSISIFTFSLVQLGVAGAERILALLHAETELDENAAGHRADLRGEIAFEHVSFGYGETPILRDVSFTARPGQTIAIVGQTGSGKSTLTRLVNRTFDVTAGRVLVDGVDVRAWSLESLRSQVASIEQDVFLFSKSIAENIAFSQGHTVDRVAIETAARQAQAHEFILEFKDGYDTVVGERGVTLSGGQRQRVAIARALLADPRILILDDSTSAVDSATEDEIQRAIRELLRGRTTLLITHRLSQIRWADWILVLRQGEVVDQGTHDELLARCDLYRRIFARYDLPLPQRVG